MKCLKSTRRLISNSCIRRIFSAIEDISKSDIGFENALPYKMVPGPKPLPFLGNNWRFIPLIGGFEIEHIDKVSQNLFEKYGKIVKMEGLLGRPDMLFLFDPSDIEQVFRQEDILPFRPSMPSLNYYKHMHRKDFFGEHGGVIAVHGEKWQSFRSKVNQIMMQPRIAKMYVTTIASTAQEFVERVKSLQNSRGEMPDDFLNELHKWSLESIAKVALDVRLGCLDENSHPDTQRLIDAVNTFFINVPVLELKIPFWKLVRTPTFNKYIEALDTIREICMKYITKSLEHSVKPNEENEISILQRILRLENDTKIATILALDMFLVGIDTTSNAAASILYQLAIHPEKQRILSNEVLNALPDKSSPITSEKLEKMAYLKACIKETLRMYPVVIGNGRQTTTDCIIGGYQIPKGVQVIFQHYVISNEEEYFPRSKEFLPERWLKSSPFFKEHHPFASLPFGFGKRMCLGRRFADLELQTLLAKVVRNYTLEYHHKKLDYFIHPMYTPNGPLRIRFIEKCV
ncbi:probable cytochrome P450 49a1 [Anoplophora glabripennis]|uniref:probable cytochrome P450 49a1 n=1 Tax=Anoplophora glabripennis TaxID=217634 RepID=UPI0008739160|nr:probable cytochrome P450 49a1 [Anoplophora glabripennis]